MFLSLLRATSFCASTLHMRSSSAFVAQRSKSCSPCIGKTTASTWSHLDRLLDGNNIDVRATREALRLELSIASLEDDRPALGERRRAQNEISVVEKPIIQPMDQRPHEQRVSAPRKARRLNTPFQYLYRHSDPWWNDNDWNDAIVIPDEVQDFYGDVLPKNSAVDSDSSERQCNSTFARQPVDARTSLLAIQYLHAHGGYTFDEIHRMHARFPPLLEMDVLRHFRPKMRFLKDCLGGATAEQVLDPRLKSRLPANFFGARLERTIAPRHAFLVHAGLPSGKSLWVDAYETSGRNGRGGGTSLLGEFLLKHRKPKAFAAMVNNWRTLYGSTALEDNLPITPEQIVAFDKLFQRGMLSAARDDSGYIFPDEEGGNASNSPSLLRTANATSARLVRHLIRHGANPWETDVRGASLFHWAAGCGNVEGLRELVAGCDRLASRPQARGTNNGTSPESPGMHAALSWKTSRDHATPFHWAAAGAGPKEFGIGGHVSVCNYFLSLCARHSIIQERELINSQTKDGNTILMWSAWSGSLDVVKLLVRSRADATITNRNGCSVAHWAASGGDQSVCQYLHEMANVDFAVANSAGNTPLSHSVAYGRFGVARWLKEDLNVEDCQGIAEDLALDFVNWADMGVGLIAGEEEVERRSVYSLFNSFKDWRGEEMGKTEDYGED